MSDPNNKTQRTFYCRDSLWELFETMARDLGCSMDYLLNESMRHYAQSRNYGTGDGFSSQPAAAPPSTGHGSVHPTLHPPASRPFMRPAFERPAFGDPYGRGFEHRTFERLPAASRAGGGQFASRPSLPSLPPAAPRASAPPAPSQQAPPYTPPQQQQQQHPSHTPAGSLSPPAAPPQPPAYAPPQHLSHTPVGPQPAIAAPPPAALQPPPPPLPAYSPPMQPAQAFPPPPPTTPRVPPPTPAAAKTPPKPASPPPPPPEPRKEPVKEPVKEPAKEPQLSLIFNGQRYPVKKDKFIIGRASQMTDLTIRDGNVSRNHCAIIRRGGQYYIKDLGSTNGLEYLGNRIDSKKLEEGDVISICEYSMRFTFR